MTGARRLFLDDGPGERRGVVLLDGAPERLLIERDGEAVSLEPGLRGTARVRRVDRRLGLAFLDLAGAEVVLPLGKAPVVEGGAVLVEVSSPPRQGKAAVARLVGEADAAPRDLLTLAQRLQALAPGVAIERGAEARDAADVAEDAIAASEHPLGAGASLSIEPTRGLTAIDIDVGGAGGAARVNRAAVFAAARLLRLKGLGGLVVFDLAGGGGRGDEVMTWAKTAFAPDMPGVAYGPVSRLGVFHLALPWRAAPVAERLFEADGRPTPRTVAQRLARLIEREAAFATRVRAFCAPDVAAEAQALRPALLARLGPRFEIEAAPGFDRTKVEVKPL